MGIVAREFNNGELKIRSGFCCSQEKELQNDIHFQKSWGVSSDPTAGFIRPLLIRRYSLLYPADAGLLVLAWGGISQDECGGKTVKIQIGLIFIHGFSGVWSAIQFTIPPRFFPCLMQQ